jgi:hypothetical protein
VWGEVHTEYWWGDHLKDPGVEMRITLKLIFNKWNGDMDWVDLAQNRNR